MECRGQCYLGFASGNQACIFGFTLRFPQDQSWPCPRETPPNNLIRFYSRAICLKGRPRRCQVWPMLREFPAPLPGLQDWIFRRRLINHVAHPRMPARLYVISIIFFLCIIHPSCSYYRQKVCKSVYSKNKREKRGKRKGARKDIQGNSSVWFS